LYELLSPKIMASFTFFAVESFLYNALCRNTGVIASGEPKCGLALHTVPSDHDILKSICESVPDVEHACYVWRWLHDNKLSLWFDFAIRGEFGLEEALFLPPRIPSGLDSYRVVCFVLRVVE
jgi:hypothetical protein